MITSYDYYFPTSQYFGSFPDSIVTGDWDRSLSFKFNIIAHQYIFDQNNNTTLIMVIINKFKNNKSVNN